MVYPVPPGELETFPARVRADGAPDFRLRPLQGETLSATQTHFVLTYLERMIPSDQILLGLDVGSQPLRRQLLELARDTGQPQIAPHPDRTQLGSGFTLYLPVYALGAPLTSPEERRAALRAWVHAGFGTAAFMQGVLGARRDKLHFSLFASGPLDADHLIYTTTTPAGAPLTFSLTHSRRIFGQDFTLAWNRGPAFVPAPRTPLLWMAVSLAIGTVLLTGRVVTLQTSRERAEALVVERTVNLAASEENLAITLHSIGDAVIATDAAGRITQMNATAERMTGWPLADAKGRSLPEVFRIVNAATRAPALDPVQKVMAHGEVVVLTDHTTLLARDGHEYQIADSAAPIRHAAGEIVGVVLVFRDVSEKYRADEALRLSDNALKRISQGVIITGPDHLILSANPAFADITGYSREESLGRDYKFLFGPLTDPATTAAIRSALKSATPFSGEIQNHRKDGIPFWNELTITPLFDEQGTLTHFLAVIRDITARRAAAQILAENLDELRRWQNVMLKREERVITLKHEVNQLLAGRDQPPRYTHPDGPIAVVPTEELPVSDSGRGNTPPGTGISA